MGFEVAELVGIDTHLMVGLSRIMMFGTKVEVNGCYWVKTVIVCVCYLCVCY